MGTGRSYIATAVAFGFITLSGCAAETAEPSTDKPVAGDWGDPELHPELGGAFSSLTAMAGSCTWNSTTGALAIVVDDTAQTVVLGVRTVDSQILVNGKVCANTAGATSKVVKTVDVSITAAGDTAAQAFVLDFLNGVFAPGVTGKAGITVNLGATSVDTLAIRGSAKADTITIGAPISGTTPISFNTDAFADIQVKDAVADKLTVSLAGGADVFSAQGTAATNFTGTYTGAVTVFGGALADVLTGGAGADTIYGGTDADTIVGGGGDDMLYGEDGDDTFNTIATADGADTINCSTGTDKVSYELRTLAVSVTVGTADLPGTDTVLGTVDDVIVPNDGDVAGSEHDHVLAGCENILGGLGNDVLVGDATANTLTGGKGNDTLQGMLGSDTFIGGDGTDLVDYSEKTTAIKVTMDGLAGDDGETAAPSGGEKDNVKVDVENIKGGTGADELIGNDSANEFWAGEGADKVSGGKGDDIFHEGPETFTAGTDGILGGAGAADDVLSTNGADAMDGGDGTDLVDYSERTLPVSVSLDGATLAATGNDGTATITGSGGARTWAATELDNVMKTVENVSGGAGADEVLGDMVAPVGAALPVPNEIEGNAGDDKLSGGYGEDTLTGSAGNDTLLGGAGDDTIEGGAGTNTVDCGDDSDIAYSATEATAGVITCELLFP
ncbi:MAG: Alkaline phosphatase [Myxococcaceae bacterium]|nr:Alkaline phosphatase [Myxococcaceae bacterium]